MLDKENPPSSQQQHSYFGGGGYDYASADLDDCCDEEECENECENEERRPSSSLSMLRAPSVSSSSSLSSFSAAPSIDYACQEARVESSAISYAQVSRMISKKKYSIAK
jgi:hypothetical protein